MKPYVLKDIPEEDMVLFKQIEEVIQEMPDIKFGNKEGKHKEKILLSCYILCRAFAKVFSVKCVDGYFFIPFWRHSWLVTENRTIIDIYPWALVGGPIMAITDYRTPWVNLYHEAEIPDLEGDDFKEHVNKTTEIIKEILKKRRLK